LDADHGLRYLKPWCKYHGNIYGNNYYMLHGLFIIIVYFVQYYFTSLSVVLYPETRLIFYNIILYCAKIWPPLQRSWYLYQISYSDCKTSLKTFRCQTSCSLFLHHETHLVRMSRSSMCIGSAIRWKRFFWFYRIVKMVGTVIALYTAFRLSKIKETCLRSIILSVYVLNVWF